MGGVCENTCEPVRVTLRGSDTRLLKDCPQCSPVVPSSQVVVHSERASEQTEPDRDGCEDSRAPCTRRHSKAGRSPRIEALGKALSDAEPAAAFVSTNDCQPADSCESEIQRGGVVGGNVLCGVNVAIADRLYRCWTTWRLILRRLYANKPTEEVAKIVTFSRRQTPAEEVAKDVRLAERAAHCLGVFSLSVR